MKIVLRSDVDGLGKKGDILDVSDGYARNYLVPKGVAMQANSGIEEQAATMRSTRDLKAAADLSSAQELAARFNARTLLITARAGEGGRLFGSVTTSDVSEAAMTQANADLDRRHLVMDDSIKTVGLHTVHANPHPEVAFDINIEVVAEDV